MVCCDLVRVACGVVVVLRVVEWPVGGVFFGVCAVPGFAGVLCAVVDVAERGFDGEVCGVGSEERCGFGGLVDVGVRGWVFFSLVVGVFSCVGFSVVHVWACVLARIRCRLAGRGKVGLLACVRLRFSCLAPRSVFVCVPGATVAACGAGAICV